MIGVGTEYQLLISTITALTPNTRIALSFSMLLFAYAGLKVSDSLQEQYPNEMPKILPKER